MTTTAGKSWEADGKYEIKFVATPDEPLIRRFGTEYSTVEGRAYIRRGPDSEWVGVGKEKAFQQMHNAVNLESFTGRGTTPISPGHYQGMSNGAEVIDITENLTFNAGNAVKYLARSSRIDGRNKGAILEDLKKSLWYVNREIERIKDGK